MINNLKNFFDRNVLNRIITGIFFIIPFVYSIIQGGYIFIIYFLLILALLICELINSTVNKLGFVTIVMLQLILIISIFHFIFLRITIGSGIEFYLLYIVISIWIFDSFSLIGGKLIGGKKLLPKISPNKTYSGLLTGFLFLLFLSSCFIMLVGNNNYMIILITLLIGLFSFFGDSIESYLKRYLKIKDFGNILPGHGGLLDRMDAFILIFFVHFFLLSFNINFVDLYA